MINHYVAPGHHLERPPDIPLVGDDPVDAGPRGLHRREVIRMAAAAGVVGLLASACSPAFPGMKVIGQAWVTSHPEEGTVAALSALVPASVDPAGKPGANLRAAAADIEADYVEGRVDWVQGWLLSRTEARIAALWYLP